MSSFNLDNQPLLIWAVVAFLAYYLFFKNKQEFYGEQFPQPYHEQATQEHVITPPPPEEIPQYAAAYTL